MVNDISLVGLDARLGRLEALHRFELAGMPEPDRQRDSLAPSPDYRIVEGPPDPPPCGCEEAEALRLKVASLMTDLAQARAMLRSAESQCEIEIGKALSERRQRIELERSFAVFALDLAHSGVAERMSARAYVPEEVATLVRAHARNPIGACDRCGARAPLQAVGIPHGEEKHACAWGCEP